MRTKHVFHTMNISAFVFAAFFCPRQLGAAPITIDFNTLRNFRDTRSLNDVGIGQGDRKVYGADVSPNTGTTITATQGSRVDGPALCNGSLVNPNTCTFSAPFNANRKGSWSLTFTNGSDTATAVTPPLDPAALLGAVPFPTDVMIAGAGVTPTLSWTPPPPSGFTPDAVRVRVYDKAQTKHRQIKEDRT